MLNHVMPLVIVSMFVVSCSKGGQQVTMQNPCAPQNGAVPANCNKPNGDANAPGGSGSTTQPAAPAKPGSTTTPSTPTPPAPPAPPSGGGGTTPPSGGGGTTPPSGGGGTTPPSGGGGTTPPSGGGGGTTPPAPKPPGPGTDYTSIVKMNIYVTPQGVHSLVFGDTTILSKFTSMTYSRAMLSMTAQATDLKGQGQLMNAGQMATTYTFNIVYDGHTCTGTASAKFAVQSPVTVMCQ